MGIYHNKAEMDSHVIRITEARNKELRHYLAGLNPWVIIRHMGRGLMNSNPAWVHLVLLVCVILFPIPYFFNVWCIFRVVMKKRGDKRDYKRIAAEMKNGTYEWPKKIKKGTPSKYTTVWLEEDDAYGTAKDEVNGRHYVFNVRADVAMEEKATYHVIFPDGTFVDARVNRCTYEEINNMETRYLYEKIVLRDIHKKLKLTPCPPPEKPENPKVRA